jgi:hypothetical protein
LKVGKKDGKAIEGLVIPFARPVQVEDAQLSAIASFRLAPGRAQNDSKAAYVSTNPVLDPLAAES